MTFHRTELNGIHSGDVFRLFDDGPFGDAVVLGFDDRGDMKVARPYVYVSGAGTTGPTPLLGCETVEIPASQIKHYVGKRIDPSGQFRCLVPGTLEDMLALKRVS